eukprot:8430988-Pyramimonas_sp.AAC.1
MASRPMMYKLIPRLLYNQLHPLWDSSQSTDQAGFRPRRSTTDHCFKTSMLQETADERHFPMWSATVDFKKAFDSMYARQHTAVACSAASTRTVHPVAFETPTMTRRTQLRQTAQADKSTSCGGQRKAIPSAHCCSTACQRAS